SLRRVITPVTEKLIVTSGKFPALDWLMMLRSVPGPSSARLVTVKVVEGLREELCETFAKNEIIPEATATHHNLTRSVRMDIRLPPILVERFPQCCGMDPEAGKPGGTATPAGRSARSEENAERTLPDRDSPGVEPSSRDTAAILQSRSGWPLT